MLVSKHPARFKFGGRKVFAVRFQKVQATRTIKKASVFIVAFEIYLYFHSTISQKPFADTCYWISKSSPW